MIGEKLVGREKSKGKVVQEVLPKEVTFELNSE